MTSAASYPPASAVASFSTKLALLSRCKLCFAGCHDFGTTHVHACGRCWGFAAVTANH